MPTEIYNQFPSPQDQLNAERRAVARRQMIALNRARKRANMEPLPLPDDPTVPACRDGWPLALIAFAIFIAGLLALQLAGN